MIGNGAEMLLQICLLFENTPGPFLESASVSSSVSSPGSWDGSFTFSSHYLHRLPRSTLRVSLALQPLTLSLFSTPGLLVLPLVSDFPA